MTCSVFGTKNFLVVGWKYSTKHCDGCRKQRYRCASVRSWALLPWEFSIHITATQTLQERHTHHVVGHSPVSKSSTGEGATSWVGNSNWLVTRQYLQEICLYFSHILYWSSYWLTLEVTRKLVIIKSLRYHTAPNILWFLFVCGLF